MLYLLISQYKLFSYLRVVRNILKQIIFNCFEALKINYFSLNGYIIISPKSEIHLHPKIVENIFICQGVHPLTKKNISVKIKTFQMLVFLRRLLHMSVLVHYNSGIIVYLCITYVAKLIYIACTLYIAI